MTCEKCNGKGTVEVMVDVFDLTIPEDRPCPNCLRDLANTASDMARVVKIISENLSGPAPQFRSEHHADIQNTAELIVAAFQSKLAEADALLDAEHAAYSKAVKERNQLRAERDAAVDIINFGVETWTGKWQERAKAWLAKAGFNA